ncbi:hypothetical protein KOEU_39250 [Komagataeibacter europaeus]|uniref:Uncharacterized protein n=1 Tax=Komagataeibacter europaeus TaxID=33995 RepID=A0A0M0ECC6_KOMEU|nr:hypothetical protein KOEU_39250 [Komagataeibacter europaeus]
MFCHINNFILFNFVSYKLSYYMAYETNLFCHINCLVASFSYEFRKNFCLGDNADIHDIDIDILVSLS